MLRKRFTKIKVLDHNGSIGGVWPQNMEVLQRTKNNSKPPKNIFSKNYFIHQKKYMKNFYAL